MLVSQLRTIALFCVVCFLVVTPAQSQAVFEACAEDIKTYCSAVKPGDGRLLACFYAHEDKVSDACDKAIGDAADQLDLFMDTIRGALVTCAADIQKHCSKVALGEGRIYRCLKAKNPALDPACGKIVNDVATRLAD